jgi:hypothetical protein
MLPATVPVAICNANPIYCDTAVSYKPREVPITAKYL